MGAIILQGRTTRPSSPPAQAADFNIGFKSGIGYVFDQVAGHVGSFLEKCRGAKVAGIVTETKPASDTLMPITRIAKAMLPLSSVRFDFCSGHPAMAQVARPGAGPAGPVNGDGTAPSPPRTHVGVWCPLPNCCLWRSVSGHVHP